MSFFQSGCGLAVDAGTLFTGGRPFRLLDV
jgi:hypothetical protein